MHPFLDIAGGMDILADPMVFDQGERDFLHNNYRVNHFPVVAPVTPQDDRHNEESIRKIDELDLSMVKMKLCLPVEKEGKGWTTEQADTAELWYKRLLKLHVLCSDKVVVPIKFIDEMWHAHILDTHRYHEDCQEIFGHYLHHFPYFGLRGEQDAMNRKNASEQSIALFEEFFFETPPCGSLSTCGPGGACK